MSYEEINAMIESIGLPSTYYQWPAKEVPELPYIVFYYPGRNDFQADNTNYVHVTELNIELYCDNKDFEHEAAVEAVLEAHDLVYSKEEMYISDERMYETLYTMEVIING